MKTRTAILAVVLSAVLAGCGSSDSTGCIPGTPTALFPDRCTTSTGTGSGGTAVGTATLALALTNSSGAATTQVSPDQAGVLKATVKDGSGAAVANAAVTFTTTDNTGAFVPSSGTALTDASGVAQVGLPAGTQAGAFTVTANTAVSGTAAKGTTSYSVVFPTLTLSALSINPATLSSGGNASVAVTVSSGSSPYAPPLPVSFSSPCVTAGKATIGSPVLTQSGIATASYVDKGCGVADVITASVTLGGATVTRTGTITVLPASAGSLKFVSANTTNIALKGTGGVGRQEFSTLTFAVYDTTGNVVAGRLVNFVFADTNSATTVGGLTLNPTSATSAADGTVTTLVTAGTIPTSVRVVASTGGVSTLSNVLVISTGVPDQKHFSLSTEVGNCEGGNFDQECSTVTVTLGDHFGNPAPDGTAVNFTTSGGVIEASCYTGDIPVPTTPLGQTTNSKVGPGSGTCSVVLRSGNPRPPTGRVTILAYALGEEDFFDSNGNNVYDSGEPFDNKSKDIFRDDNEDGIWNPGEPCIGPNTNGICSSVESPPIYNGVLNLSQAPHGPPTLYVSRQLIQIFSGSSAAISFNPPALVCAPGGTTDVQFTVTDQNGRIMPAGTKIELSVVVGTAGDATVTPALFTVPNVVLAVGQPLLIPTYTATVGCGAAGGSGRLFVKVITPNAIETPTSIPIN